MSRPHVSPRPLVAVTAAALALLSTSCVDSPAAPDAEQGPVPFVIAPSLALAGPGGAPAATAAQEGALNEAFQRVDRFRVEVRDGSGGLVLDTVISVTPGQDEYDFQLPVEAEVGATLTVTLTAFQGDTELFRSGGIQVRATASTGTPGAEPPAPADITLSYSGPGATAASVELDRTHLVLGPGADGTLTARVLDGGGGVIPGVPLSWSAVNAGVATVTEGTVTGVADGLTEVVVTTPTGLEARARAYVLGGDLAYVRGGVLQLRPAAGGPVAQQSAAGASQPAWSADGARLFYVLGGSVRETGIGAPVTAGAWPSLSPDGTKLAVERSGRVWFANDNGQHPTQGPSGSAPVWSDASTLVVAGGSIQRVRADGAGRETLAGGETGPPARGPDGRVAYVTGGELRVVGGDGPLAAGVTGRPSWSADGQWLAVAGGGGILVLPADGSAPAVALPGLEGASGPAFRPAGSLSTPPVVSVTGLDPSPPIPGEPVEILGNGFDWIIPANNRVTWPTRDGPVVGEVVSVTPSALVALVPRAVTAGEVTVENRNTRAALAFEPTSAALEVVALTPDERPVPGVLVVVTDPAGSEVGRSETDADGKAMFSGLLPGIHRVALTAPMGFALDGTATRSVEVVGGVHRVPVVLTPDIAELHLTPDALRLEVGSTLAVTAVALTASGDTVRSPGTITWASGDATFGVAADGLRATLTGRAPSREVGSSTLTVTVNGRPFTFGITVTSFVRGFISQEAETEPPPQGPGVKAGIEADATPAAGPATEPAIGVGIVVRKGGEVVAREASGGDGRYTVPGLLAGTYTVSAIPTEKRSPVPFSVPVVLSSATPTASGVDFLMTLAPVDTLEVAPLATLTAFEQRKTISYTPRDSLGNPLSRPATFSVADTSIVKVTASGVVIAKANGSTTVDVTVEGFTETITVTVAQEAAKITAIDSSEEGAPEPDSVRALRGDTATVEWEAEDANGFAISPAFKTPTYTSSDESILTISPIGPVGAVSIFGVGRVEATVEMDGATDTIIVWVFDVWSGDYDVSIPGDVATFASGLYGMITGSLIVESTALTTLGGLGLETVWEIVGHVSVQYNASLTDVSALAGVEEIGGDLVVEDNDMLDAPGGLSAELETVGGDVRVADNLMLSNVDLFSGLWSIGGDLVVEYNDALDGLDGLASLTDVGDDVRLVQNPSLSSLSNLPALELVPGDLVVEDGGTVVGLPSIRTIEGELWVGGSAATGVLERLHVPAVTTVGVQVYIYGNTNLTTVDLGALLEIGDMGEEIRLEPGENPARLRRASEGRGASIRRLGDEGTADYSYYSGLTVDDNESLATLDLASLFEVYGDVHFGGDLALGAISLPSLTHIDGSLSLTYLDGPTAAFFPSLTDVYWMEVYDNQTLASLAAESLVDTGDNLTIAYNLGLSTVSLPALEEVGWTLEVMENSGLASVSFPSLMTIAHDLELGSNPDLVSASAPELTSVDELEITGNPSLATLGLGSLATVDGRVYVYDNDALVSLSLPALTRIGNGLGPNSSTGDLTIEGNAVLTGVGLPMLSSVNGALTIRSNDALPNLGGFSAITSSMYSVLVEFNTSLSDTGGTSALFGLHSIGSDAVYASAVQNSFAVQDNGDGESFIVDTCEVFFDVIDVIDDAYGDDPATAFPGLLTVEGNSSNPCT